MLIVWLKFYLFFQKRNIFIDGCTAHVAHSGKFWNIQFARLQRRIEIFIKLSITLFIMVNSSLTQITLSAVVKVHITTLFKCDCSGFRHLQFLHSKIPFKLTKKVGHIMGKNPKMMCPTKKFYIFTFKKFAKVLKPF